MTFKISQKSRAEKTLCALISDHEEKTWEEDFMNCDCVIWESYIITVAASRWVHHTQALVKAVTVPSDLISFSFLFADCSKAVSSDCIISISQHMKRTSFDSFISINSCSSHTSTRMFVNCNINWDHEHSISKIDISAHHVNCSCYVHLRCFLKLMWYTHSHLSWSFEKQNDGLQSKGEISDCSWLKSSSNC